MKRLTSALAGIALLLTLTVGAFAQENCPPGSSECKRCVKKHAAKK